MNKLFEIDNCIDCPAWTYENHTDYCKIKNRIIPDGAREFPKWCPLKTAERFNILNIFRRSNQ